MSYTELARVRKMPRVAESRGVLRQVRAQVKDRDRPKPNFFYERLN